MDQDRSRGGRPRKSEGPRVPYEEVDRVLVFGEVVPCEDGNGTTVVYPSYRELAERYGVSNSVIAEYAKTHNVQRRRREAQARIQAKAENKIVEMRATAIALSKETTSCGSSTAISPDSRPRWWRSACGSTTRPTSTRWCA